MSTHAAHDTARLKKSTRAGARRLVPVPAAGQQPASLKRADAQQSVVGAVRALAERLSQVVVDLGPGMPRLQSYAESVRIENGEPRLVLAPIATHALPILATTRHARVIFADDSGDLALSVSHIRGEGPAQASVSLSRARLEALPVRRDARVRPSGTQHLVLMVPGGLDDMDPHAFPIVDVSASTCTIETKDAFVPGTVLQPVEIVGDRDVLRRAQGTVLDTMAWYTADGEPRFRTRLAIESSEGSQSGARAYDRLSSADRVRRIVDVAALARPAVSALRDDGSRVACTLEHAGTSTLTLRLAKPIDGAWARTRLSFELFGSSYELDVRVISVAGEEVTTAVPLVVRRRRQRREMRTAVGAADQVFISYTSPVSRRRERHAVRDVSSAGLCFAADAGAEVIWSGLPLDQVSLEFPGGELALGDVEVRSIDRGAEGALLCHATMRAADRAGTATLVDLIGRLRHPMLRAHEGKDFDEIVDLYLGVGLFGPHMVRNLPAARAAAALTWKAMHSGPAAELCRTLEHREGDKPMAAVSAVRAWERSWVIQHMVAAPSRKWREPGALHLAYLDYVLPRPDGQFLVVYVKSDNDRITDFLDRFFDLTGTPEAVARRGVELWCAGPEVARPAVSGARELGRGDATLVATAAARALGSLAANALSMTADELHIDDTRRRFGAAGVERSRDVRLVDGDSGAAYAVVHERASAGFNLTWMLNASWLLPVHAKRHDDGAALETALDEILAQEPTPAGDRFAIVLPGTDRETLKAKGFHMVSPVNVHFYNRAGLVRWGEFLRETFGEIGAQRASAGRA